MLDQDAFNTLYAQLLSIWNATPFDRIRWQQACAQLWQCLDDDDVMKATECR